MSKFKCEVHGAIYWYKDVYIDAKTKEEAEEKAREQAEEDWNYYDVEEEYDGFQVEFVNVSEAAQGRDQC